MLQRRISIALGASVAALVVQVGTWFTLNYFRVQYYNDAMEEASAQTSPYWKIIRAQDILLWPLGITAACVMALVVLIVAHYVKQAIFTRESAIKR
jgi:hypothetical protein